MAKNKVYLTAKGGKTSAGAEDAAFIVNADDVDRFTRLLLKANASEPTAKK